MDTSALRILRLLVSLLPTVKADDPRTFIGYKAVHDRLGLGRSAESWGDSLKAQGLLSLAEWCEQNGHPAVTGLVIDVEKLSPGKGYYSAFGRAEDDFDWWFGEIRRAKAYNWAALLPENPTPPPTPNAVDIEEPPLRGQITTYRVLRDTVLAREVKRWHDYRCQICGQTIILPNGERYAEVHHIRPLGAPHNGPDRAENILCLCPNHHVEFDYGVRQLDLAELRVAQQHKISKDHAAYHNNRIWGGKPPSENA